MEAIISYPDKSRIIHTWDDMGLDYIQYDSLAHGRTPPTMLEFDRGMGTVKEEFSKNVMIMTVISDSIARR